MTDKQSRQSSSQNSIWSKIRKNRLASRCYRSRSVIKSRQEPSRYTQTEGKSFSLTDLGKVSGLIIGGLTFAVLLSDWSFLQGFYSELGISNLTYGHFVASPVHVSGFVNLIFIAILSIPVPLISLAYPQPYKEWRLPELAMYVLVLILSVWALWPNSLWKNPIADLQSIDYYMFSIGLIGITAFLYRVVVHFTPPASAERLMLFVFLGVIMLFALSFGMIDAASELGSEIAQTYLEGEKSFPPVGLVTNKPVLIASFSQSLRISDERWLYLPSYITHPDSTQSMSTMQYVAEVGGLLYILENGNSVHVIPMKNVDEIFLFSNSEVMIPRRSITIPSHIPVISSTSPISITMPFSTAVP